MGLCGTKSAQDAKAPIAKGQAPSTSTSSTAPAKGKRDMEIESDSEDEPATTPSLKQVSQENSTRRASLMTDRWGNIEEFYDLDKNKLGQGAFGCVSKATSKETSNVRAVKSLSKARAKEIKKLYRREIAVMKLTDHPHIIKLFETFEDKKHIYVVMEFCIGGDLFQRLNDDGPFKEAKAAIVMQQILRTICHLHSRGIVHRDIKPENFLFMRQAPVEENTVKIIDFGLSCTFEEGVQLSTKLGTPRYSSPQVLAGAYTESCDLWSCGVIMYVLLCGQPPFQGKNDAEVMACVRRGNYTTTGPAWQNTNASKDSKDLIRMLLKFQPEERYTARQALAHSWIKGWVPQATGAAPLRPSIILDLRNFCAQHWLRRAALQVIAQQLDEEETRAFRRTFAALDTRGVGVFTVAELEECLKDRDMKGVSAEMRQVIGELGAGNGQKVEIGFSDFLAATLETRHYIKEAPCRAAFRAFDRDGDGVISREELEFLCKSQDKDGVQQSVNDVIREVDLNRDGVIDFKEFRKMLVGDSVSVL